jgi:hypothetical protein
MAFEPQKGIEMAGKRHKAEAIRSIGVVLPSTGAPFWVASAPPRSAGFDATLVKTASFP